VILALIFVHLTGIEKQERQFFSQSAMLLKSLKKYAEAQVPDIR